MTHPKRPPEFPYKIESNRESRPNSTNHLGWNVLTLTKPSDDCLIVRVSWAA